MSPAAPTFLAHRLVYRARTTITTALASQGRDRPDPPSTEQTEIVVLLGDDWQSTREGSSETVIDAAAKRVHMIDHDAGTVFSQSLYARVAFREAEARNRRAIMKVIEAGRGEPPCTRADIEACLGVELDEPGPPRLRRALLRRERWMQGRTEVASEHSSDYELPRRVLRRWLAHEVMIHPKIAEAIADKRRAPQRLEHRVGLIGERYERTLTLASASIVEIERDAGLRGLEPQEPSDELHVQVRALLERPLDGLPDRMAKGHTALEAGEHLEAFLWFMAHNWADGSNDPSGMAALNEVLSEEEFAYGFRLAVLTAGQGEHLGEVLKVYDMAEARAGSLGHVIGVIRANALTEMVRREKDPELRGQMIQRARSELLHAIDVDPGLAGVYKDLGDLCLALYNMALVWELWDFGRRLAPDHSLFDPVAEYERHLTTSHPQFF